MIGAVVVLRDYRLPVGYVVQENGCWEWTGPPGAQGYGYITVARRRMSAHLYVWETYRGPVAPGLELDHLCRNRMCVRPDHLEPVTRRENILRGIGPAAQHARKTHCPQGHPYSEANTYHFANGPRRRCRICAIRQAAEGKRRLRARRYVEQGGAAPSPDPNP